MQEPSISDPSGDCSSAEPFALQVIGNSMEPEFPDGCIVVIEPAGRCRHGMYIMALVEGVRWFRRYLKDGGSERLIALNDTYPPIDLAGLDWQVEGVIVQRNLGRGQSPTKRRNVKHYSYR